MNLGPICHAYYIHEFYEKDDLRKFSNYSLQIWWLIRGKEVMKRYKISAQYL